MVAVVVIVVVVVVAVVVAVVLCVSLLRVAQSLQVELFTLQSVSPPVLSLRERVRYLKVFLFFFVLSSCLRKCTLSLARGVISKSASPLCLEVRGVSVLHFFIFFNFFWAVALLRLSLFSLETVSLFVFCESLGHFFFNSFFFLRIFV